jgi:hypothetical protein
MRTSVVILQNPAIPGILQNTPNPREHNSTAKLSDYRWPKEPSMANPIETIEVEIKRNDKGEYLNCWRLTTRKGDKSYDISKVDQKESLKGK